MVTPILTRAALDEEVKYFLDQDAFAFDVESQGANRGVPTQNSVSWLSMATYGRGVVIPFGHPNGNRLIRRATKKKNKVTNKFEPIPAVYDDPPEQMRPSEVFEALEPLFFSERIKIAHNATFDLISVAKYFGEIPAPTYHDTIVIQWLLNENLKTKRLKDLIESYYGVVYDEENIGRCVEAHPFNRVAQYSYLDSKYTWLLWRRLFPRIAAQGLEKIFALEERVLGVLLDMGVEGAPVDVDALRELETELADRLVDIEADIYRKAGRKFNLNAPMQKANVLFGSKADGGQGLKPKVLTPGGMKKEARGLRLEPNDYSTQSDYLEVWQGKNAVVDGILGYQEVAKLLGTYVRGYLGDPTDAKKPCVIFDGRVHTDLVQYGTVSGRFSSRAPNLQNIPRPDTELGKKIRGLFVAPSPEHRLVVADYGQIEMVLLAHFAGPGPLFHGLHQGNDPHTQTAAGVFGVPVEEVTKDQRQAGKGINFAVVYGAWADKVAAMAGVSVREAKAFLDAHEEAFPEVYRFKRKALATCRSRRPPYLRTLLGRKRRIPAIMAGDDKTRRRAERQAINSLIQGSAADVIKYAMIRLNETLEEDMRLILSVHDELVTIAPAHKAERCAELVREAMLGEDIQKLVNVPLSSDVKIVDRWSEAK